MPEGPPFRPSLHFNYFLHFYHPPPLPSMCNNLAMFPPLQPKQSDIMADCGYAEDCYLLKYLLPFTQAYRKAAKGVVGCSGQSVQKVIIPELEELPPVDYLEQDYHNYGESEFTSEEEEFDDEDENAIEDGEEEEDEEEEANSTRCANDLIIGQTLIKSNVGTDYFIH